MAPEVLDRKLSQPARYWAVSTLFVVAVLGGAPNPQTLQATSAAFSNCTGASPNDWEDDTAALRACLENQEYVISDTLFISRNDQLITSSMPWSAKIIAADHFQNHRKMLRTVEPPPRDYVIDLITFDGRLHNRQGLETCAPGSGEGNLHLDGWRYTLRNSEILRAKCGAGLALLGSDYTIFNNYIAWSGSDQGPGSAPWADGITVLTCPNGNISYNTIVDSTDIAIAMGGGRGCQVHHNYIWQGGKTAFAGIVVGNFTANGAGDHTDSSVHDNTIIGAVPDRLQLGLLVGPHPWTTFVPSP